MGSGGKIEFEEELQRLDYQGQASGEQNRTDQCQSGPEPEPMIELPERCPACDAGRRKVGRDADEDAKRRQEEIGLESKQLRVDVQCRDRGDANDRQPDPDPPKSWRVRPAAPRPASRRMRR